MGHVKRKCSRCLGKGTILGPQPYGQKAPRPQPIRCPSCRGTGRQGQR